MNGKKEIVGGCFSESNTAQYCLVKNGISDKAGTFENNKFIGQFYMIK